jgi:hypothetical protein
MLAPVVALVSNNLPVLDELASVLVSLSVQLG